MTPAQFSQANMIWAKDQPEYKPLPAFTDETQTITCWQMSWRERLAVFFSGKVWLRQLNFGKALQPQLVEVCSPFIEVGSVEDIV